ncbi:hypothetical protein [Chryseobacterium sp.]|uniref:hypothetical protein n=1 Tax=Chryseobacterium sp. TaxID=1871047 RepID=UPI002FC6174F
METEEVHDIKLYVKASIADIRNVVEPLVGAGLDFIQNKSSTVLSFAKPNTDYLIREINRFIGNAVSHNDISLPPDIFKCTLDERRQFIKGFADVTGYIRRSNAYFNKFEHRVYFEIPHNWQMVIDICNLLKSTDIPVQTIDWAHPNMRDGDLTKYNEGKPGFWKKEHQIKVWANEFTPIGFGIIHKQQALEMFSDELIAGYRQLNKDPHNKTHKYYWDSKRKSKKIKPDHPSEDDEFIPLTIRGKHFNSWTEIAKELGYVK